MHNHTSNHSRAKHTSNGQISEEEPARDEGLLWVAGGFVHDVQVWGVEAQGGGWQAVGHQVHPEQLHWDQSLREPQDGCQEDAGERVRRNQHQLMTSDST